MIAFTADFGAQSTRVFIGPLAEVGPLQALGGGKPVVVVTDPRVWSLHGDKLPFAPDPVFVPEGEDAKQWHHLSLLVDEFARRGVDRSSPVVAFGGGAIGDLAGLAASLFKRGCPVIQIPTTLLAQADSALGGKTAIDAAGQKNLVGSFHHPVVMAADPSLIATLDMRQRQAGYAEIVKYGLIADSAFFAWCEVHGGALLEGDQALMSSAVETALRCKSAHVAGDVEDRTGRRALLNFGHSFGHAIEQVAGIGRILHGEAVAIGMVLAARFSSLANAERVAAHLASVGLPVTLADAGLGGHGDALFEAMRGDKKNQRGEIRLVLLNAIGAATLRSVDPDDLHRFLQSAA